VRLKFVRNSHKRRRIGMSERPPDILIRLLENCGLLPCDFCYRLPERVALSLIAKRKATVVGALGATADLSLTLEECIEAGIA
jgi:hypothetical protein